MNETALTWLIFILAFGGMVIIHEFGHFIAARLVKVEVEEFGIGLPTPGAITMFTWQGTRFTLNWLPLGGFVRPKGENDPNIEGGLAAAAPWKRLVVLTAGPLMNLITAVLIFGFMLTRVGIPVPAELMVSDIVPGSPAEAAGLQSGDILLSGRGLEIHGYEDLRTVLDSRASVPTPFLIDRNGKQMELTVTPTVSEDQRVIIGIYFDELYVHQPATSPLQVLQVSTRYTYNSIRFLISLPAQWIRGALPAEQGRLVGLKGIYDILGQSIERDLNASSAPPPSAQEPTANPFSTMWTLSIIASLSISLGVFNLFPFPALDGGRIIFVIPELLFRRRVPHQFENLVHGLGMAFLLAVMIYVNVMEFVNPVQINLP
ncbi:MAG: hypothetical protein C3F07_21140 [Anaerolineales bacterium]|nr:site-2 protease family protein [Anaerolineae bacterium]PWB68875.1 MAG: hypothetical protein C3F07_21140 [Anaerolineales bacterium]